MIQKNQETNTPAKNYAIWLILLISLLALAIRVWGIGFGLPHAFHPDEPKALTYVRYCWSGNFSPYPFGWDPLYGTYTFIIFFGQKLLYGLLSLFGYLPFLQNHAAFFRNSETIFLVGRGTTALLGALTVTVIYLLGKKLFNNRIGLTAALILTFSVSHIENSRFIKPDVPIILFIALSVLFAVYIYETGKIWAYLLSGLCVGLALAAKINGCAVGIAGLTAHLLYCRKMKTTWTGAILNPKLLLFIFAIFIGTFIGCPYIFLDWQGFFNQLKWYLEDQARGRGPIYFRWGWLHFLRNINVGMGTAPALLCYAGFLYALWQHKHRHLILISFPLAYFLISGKSTFVAQRYTIQVIPFLAIFGGLLLDTIVNRITKKKLFNYSLYLITLLAFLSAPIKHALADGYFLWLPSTRTIAEEWINNNIPPGTAIALESYSPDISLRKYKTIKYPALGFQPVKNYQELGYEYMITTDFAHNRYIYSQRKDKYQNYIDFYNDLDNDYPLVKEFYLWATGFCNPRIKIYKLEKKIEKPTPPYLLYPPVNDRNPRIFCFLTGSPEYQDNLRPIIVDRKTPAKYIIVSPKKLEEIGLLLRNGKAKNTLSIKTHCWQKKKIITLLPFESKLITLSLSPSLLPVKYYYTISVTSRKAGKTQVQLLTDPYELAIGYAEINDWQKAFPVLKTTLNEKPEKNSAFSLSATYPAGKLLRNTGEVINNSCFYDKNIDAPGLLTYGPYLNFSPGKYITHFYLKGEKDSRKELGKIEVSCAKGSKILAQHLIKGSDFIDNIHYQDFSLPFFNSHWHNELEFRTSAAGTGNLQIEKIVIEPDLDYCYRRNQSRLYVSRGDYKKAAALLPEDTNLRQQLAENYFLQDDPDNARTEYEKLLRQHPNNLNTLGRLGKLYLREGNTQKANEMAARMKKLFPPEKSEINFANSIKFLGYEIDKENVKPGDIFIINYYWQCLDTIERNLIIFVHFTKANGKVKFQNDHQPQDSASPTITWQPGDIIKETFAITVPPDLSPGTYDIRLGIHDPFITQQRLKVVKTDLPTHEERVIIGKLQVK